MLHLDYRDARPIYVQIIDGFQDQIRKGILQRGERLPSIRELAISLTINPNTIQSAYRELEAKGWIASVPGKGSFVCGVPFMERLDDPQLEEFDRLVAALEDAGITRAQLIERLQGGSNHARNETCNQVL